MGKKYSGTGSIKSYNVSVGAPVDTRTVVETLSDLTNYSTFTTTYYVGMVVYVIEEQSIYVLTSVPSGTTIQIKKNWATQAVWTKVGDSDSDSSNNAAVILDSEDGLTSITTPTPYKGMIAVVKDNGDTSENESGLYVLISDDSTVQSNWLKIGGGSSVSSNVDITTDGTAPASGNGFSIDPDPEDSDVYVEDTYVNYTDGKLLANTYYTGNGFGSFNGGYGNLEGVESVELTKGLSTIKFWASGVENSLNHWIKFDLQDDSFGITYSDIIDEDGNAYTTGQFDVENSKAIKFLNVVDFNGANEQRYYNEEDSDSYTFGEEDSCTIGDLDIYISKVLPTVYAYVNNDSVRVLTEGDRADLESMIESSVSPITITEDDIDSLFGDSSESEIDE